jgi:hypothetical protein
MNEQQIARAGQEVGKLDLADHILSWDKKQAREIVEVTPGTPARGPFDAVDTNRYRMVPNPVARRCPIDPSHGILQIGRNGDALLCCVARPTPCDYSEPVSR